MVGVCGLAIGFSVSVEEDSNAVAQEILKEETGQESAPYDTNLPQFREAVPHR